MTFDDPTRFERPIGAADRDNPTRQEADELTKQLPVEVTQQLPVDATRQQSRPTVVFPADVTRQDITGATRMDQDPANQVTRRENQARTRREQSANGAGTRRDTGGQAKPVRTRRLSLPAGVAKDYDYLYDLPAAGGEADIALLQAKSGSEQVIFKYYKAGMAPDPMAMLLLGQADSQHVVKLIDFHNEDDGTWELQEYCRLGSLRDWVWARGGRLDQPTLLSVVREIAKALSYLHALGSGIAHRDLKPGNILVRAEQPLDLVLADFGLARAQQQFTQFTATIKGTWHYAAPEVHARQSSAKSDWFSLGAMIYEFYTGRKLFASADGSEVGEDEARVRCQAGNYSTELITDARLKMLVDGLLTWDKEHRWGAVEVQDWLRGKSPRVNSSSPNRVGATVRSVGYRPNWSPVLVRNTEELAEQMRQHWDEAAAELAGRPDMAMIRFLEGFPGMEECISIIRSGEPAGSKLVRLQALLDPRHPVYFEGTTLDDAAIGKRIESAASGNESALNWLQAVIDDRVLTAYAEVTGSAQAAEADYWLARWKQQANREISIAPPELRDMLRQAFRRSLPMLFTSAFNMKRGNS